MSNVFFEAIKASANCRHLPPKLDVSHFVDKLIDFLFPYRQKSTAFNTIDLEWAQLQIELQMLINPLMESKDKVQEIVAYFFKEIPLVYQRLKLDAEEILQNDPAAHSIEEVIVAYPGFYAIAVYRVSNILHQLQVPILPRIISEHAHSLTGIDIHPGATIGEHFFIDHGTGIVIGETTIIGKFVKIYQGVTLGALSVKKNEGDTKRHPTIEDNVTIYSNSTILGGNTVIGNDTLIGGNVFLTYSVPPFSTVYHKSEVRVRQAEENFIEPINFVI
jgi:serine O-acetyltransferase